MRLTKLVALGLYLIALQTHAAVNDVLPGDYFPLPAGQTTLSVYAYDRELQGPYAEGRKTFDGRIDSNVLAVRAAHFFQVGETTLAGVAVLPWSNSRVSPSPLAAAMGKEATGAGDLRLGLTAWLINDKTSAHYLGISGMLITPSGEYTDRQLLNSGENRWRFVFSGGWQKDITPTFLVELSPEIAYYGDNDEYVGNRRLEQRTSYALTGYLRWRLSPMWHAHLGGQISRGGETRINGIEQRNPANTERVMAGLTMNLPDRQQLILRYAEDVAIDYGFRSVREFLLRYQKGF